MHIRFIIATISCKIIVWLDYDWDISLKYNLIFIIRIINSDSNKVGVGHVDNGQVSGYQNNDCVK